MLFAQTSEKKKILITSLEKKFPNQSDFACNCTYGMPQCLLHPLMQLNRIIYKKYIILLNLTRLEFFFFHFILSEWNNSSIQESCRKGRVPPARLTVSQRCVLGIETTKNKLLKFHKYKLHIRLIGSNTQEIDIKKSSINNQKNK